jgi:hypothetical protein
MLPYLASYVGYKYDYNVSVETNRLIIKYYNNLIRYRGSNVGMQLAMSLSVNTTDTSGTLDALSMFKVEFDSTNSQIKIFLYYPSYLTKVRDLIEVVRPAGVPIEFIAASPIETVDKVDIVDYINTDKSAYSKDKNFSVGNENEVGFGQVAKDKNG